MKSWKRKALLSKSGEWIRVVNATHLKQLCQEGMSEFKILLGFGGQSSKTIHWDAAGNEFNVFNDIDGTSQHLTLKQIMSPKITNIGEAIKRRAFWGATTMREDAQEGGKPSKPAWWYTQKNFVGKPLDASRYLATMKRPLVGAPVGVHIHAQLTAYPDAGETTAQAIQREFREWAMGDNDDFGQKLSRAARERKAHLETAKIQRLVSNPMGNIPKRGRATPGHWNYDGDQENMWVLDSRNRYLAEIVTRDDEGFYIKDPQEREANARLMASAPTLREHLVALIAAVRYMDSDIDNDSATDDFVTAARVIAHRAYGLVKWAK